LEIGVEVYSEDLVQGTRTHTNSCLVTMVCVDEKGRPAPVPPLLLETPDDKARWNAAEERRRERQKQRRG
jgi:acyl-CoA hydrolase